ncbi:MAG: hypothetical protein HY244_09265 [Rhizobiales bacterium]|nr:hypothetical protein [Hyphomicrobiales bacterium]
MLKRSTAIVMLALLATPAVAGPDSEVLRKLGMLGVWAVDCAKPPGNGNFYIEHIPSERGYPTRKTSAGAKPTFAEMRNVRPISSDRIAFLDVRLPDGDKTDIVLAFTGDSLRSQESSDPGGKAHIKDGKFLSSGAPTPIFKKCKDGQTQ